jgi:putative PEP-CTERM system histidine kinase
MNMNWIALPSALSALTATGLGLFVWSRNVRGLAHRFFAVGMAALGIIEMGNALALFSSTDSDFLFWNRISWFGEILKPLAWWIFTLVFGQNEPKKIWLRWRFPLIGSVFVSLVFISLLGSEDFLRSPSTPNALPSTLNLGPIGYVFLVYLLLSSVLILSQIESAWRSASESRRWQIKFLLIGIGTIFAFTFYASSQTLLFRSFFPQLIPIQSLINLTAFGLIAFALVRHRNLEVDIFVSRQMVYGSTIVLITSVYLIGTGLLSNVLNTFGGGLNPFLPPLIVALSVIGLVIVLSSGQVRRRLALFISEHFYKHKHDFHLKWLQATEQLGPKRTPRELVPALIGFLKETLGTTSASIWLYEKDKQRFIKTDVPRLQTPEESLWIDPASIEGLVKARRPLPLKDIVSSPPFKLLSFLKGPEADVLVPLLANNRLIGLIILGPDMTGKPYVQNDYDLLKAVGNQVAYQLLNAQLADELASAKELEAFHEVSTFVIHDLKNLTNTLSLMVQNAQKHFDKPAFRSEALRSLIQIVEKLKSFVSRLSGFSKRISPNPSPSDLNSLIVETLRTLDGAITAEVVNTLSPLPPMMIDRDQFKAALTNLLINAQEAITATTRKGAIRINTRHENQWIILSIADNGRGMSSDFIEQQLFKPFRTTKSLGLGIGLFQTQKIVEAHGGTIDVQSQEDVGTEIDIRLPAVPEVE